MDTPEPVAPRHPPRPARWWSPLLLAHAALVAALLAVRPQLPPTTGFEADGPGVLHGVVFATEVLLGAPWWLLTSALSSALPAVLNLVLHAGLVVLTRRRRPPLAPGTEGRRPASTSSRFGLAALAGLAVWAAWLGWDDTTSYDVVTRQDESPYVVLQVLGCALTVGVVTALLAARWSPVAAAAGVSVGFWWGWTAWGAASDSTGFFLIGSIGLAFGLAAGTSFAAFAGVVVGPCRARAIRSG